MSALAIVIIINVLFFLLLGLGVFLGIKRGLEFSLIHLGFVVVALVIALFISNPISKAILSIKIGGEPLGEKILSLMGGVADASPALKGATIGTICAILSPITFLIIGLLTYGIFEIVYQLIVRLLLKKNGLVEKKANLKWYGSIVGIFEMFFFIVLLFMPITSLSRTILGIIEEPTTSAETVVEQKSEDSMSIKELAEKYVPKLAIESLKKYNASPMGKIICMGGLDNIVYRGMNYIKAGDQKFTITDDFEEFVHILDNVLQEATYYYKNYETADKAPLKLALNDLIDSPFKGFVEDVLKDLIINRESLADSMGLTYNYEEPIIITLEKYKDMLEDENFDLGEYLKENLSILIDGVDSMAKDGGLKELLTNLDKRDVSDLINAKTMSSFKEASRILLTAPIAKDIYPVFYTILEDQFPTILSNYIDVTYLETFEAGKYEFPEIFDILSTLGGVETDAGNLFKELIKGNSNFAKDLIMSDQAVSLVKRISTVKSLRNVVYSIFGKLDDTIFDALEDITGNSMNKLRFGKTISAFDDDEKIDGFFDNLYENADAIVSILRYTHENSLTKDNIATLLNLMRDEVLSGYDKQTESSTSVFATAYDNIVKVFTGKINAIGKATPAFENFETVTERIDEAYASYEGEKTEEMKYLIVDWKTILLNLI